MTYGPAVTKQCEYCKQDYKCANHRVNKSRFCSITCHNKSGLLKRIQYTCVHCDNKFIARPDHGAERKFCSRKCFLEDCVQPKDKECECCGGMFTATRSSTATRGDGWRLYCSNKCKAEHSRKFEERPCVFCGKLFYPRSIQHDQTQKTCSTKCKSVFFSGSNATNFQGGEHVVKTTNHKMVLIGKRKGYVGKYTAEHRLVIAKYIGRMLTRNEIVIHINNDGLNNKLSNLFLCESMSEYSFRRHGSLPWPKKSNLNNFKESKNA
jgi:hypothetical protein